MTNWKIQDAADIGTGVLTLGASLLLLKHVENKVGRFILWTGLVSGVLGLGVAIWRTSGDLLVNATPGGV